MSKQVIAHIVGISNFIKDDIIAKINKKFPDITVVDVDPIVPEIRTNDDFSALNNLLKDETEKDKCEEIKNKIHAMWKTLFQAKLELLINKSPKNKIVLIGYTNYYKNYKIMPDIQTNLKIFYMMDDVKAVKQIIEHNLDTYRQEIIDNKFPLNFLSTDYLLNQRKRLIEIYTNAGYLFKEELIIYKLLETFRQQTHILPDLSRVKTVYIGFQNKYMDMLSPMEFKKETIIGYTEEWLALLAAIPNILDFVKKGYEVSVPPKGKPKLIPFVQEIAENGFKKLQDNCYLYHVEKTNFEIIDMDRSFKLKSSKPVKIVKRIYVEDVMTRLQLKKIKFVSFKK